MENINRVFLLGTVADVFECRYTSSGTAFLNFSVMTVEKFHGSRSGGTAVKKDWHKIAVWGQRAEELAPKIRKGVKIFIEGRLTVDSWVDRQTGEKKYITRVNATKACCLDSANIETATPPPEPQTRTPQPEMDDVPF